MAVPFNANDREAGLTLIRDLTSFERVFDMAKTLGNSFPQKGEPAGLARGVATLPLEVLRKHFLPEPDADELVKFEQAWRAEVLLKP